MLLIDGSLNDSEDLRAYESAILDVAHTEMIDLNPKLALAAEEIAEDVLDFLLDHSGADPQGSGRRGIGVADVVVSGQMKRWHAAHTLEIVYRDAFNNQLNDRYQPKFLEYRELARNAREHTFHFGVGLVLSPIPRPAPPVFSILAGPIPQTTYYAQATWVGASGQEGFPSGLTTYDAPAGSVPVIEMTNPPAVAVGFNVYLGLTADDLELQNGASAVPVGQSFVLPGTGLVDGRPPGEGQAADVYVSGGRVLLRG